MMTYLIIAVTIGWFSTANLSSNTSSTEVIWQRQLGNCGYSEKNPVFDITTDGGLVVAGSLGQNDPFDGLESDIVIYHLDSLGSIILTKVIKRPERQFPRSIVCTEDGGSILALNCKHFINPKIILIKMDSEGSIIWERQLGGSIDDSAEAVLQTHDGGYIICGSTNSFGSSYYDYDVYIIRTDSLGNIIWEKTYGNSAIQLGMSIVEDEHGDFLIAGCDGLIEGSGECFDVLFLKISSTGDSLWTRNYGGDDTDIGRCIIKTEDGGFLIAGESWSYSSSRRDAYAIKIDSKANIIWESCFGDDQGDNILSCIEIHAGQYLLAGHSGDSNPKSLVAILNSRGDLMWSLPFGEEEYYGSQIRRISFNRFAISGTSVSEDFDHQIEISVFQINRTFFLARFLNLAFSNIELMLNQ